MRLITTGKRWLPFILLLCLGSAYAQSDQSATVSGVAKEQSGNPLQFATVVLMNSDSIPINGAVTDENGAFQISAPYAQNATLVVSSIGFQTYQSSPFDLSESQPQVEMNDIVVQEDAELLDEVAVTALRPQVVMEADKMVVSVEGTAMASGSTAYEVLEKSPGVFVDQDGNIQLNGRNNVRIMVDGRPSYLSAQELRNLLQGMSADNIKQIEIIANPSAKYDAEGQAGIIDIRLKKNTMRGINGSVNAGTRNNGEQGYNGGLQLNMKTGDWNSFVTGNYMRNPGGRENTMYREFNGAQSSSFDQRGEENRIFESPSIRVGTDYDFSERQSIGAQIGYSRFEGDIDFFTRSFFAGDTNEDPLVTARNLTAFNVENKSANLHYSLQFDSVGTKMTADFNVIGVSNDGGATFTNRYFDNNENQTRSELLETVNPTSYDIISGQLDFEIPLGKGKIETGIKASSVTSDNDLQFYMVEGNDRTLDNTRSNHFIYEERISAGYVSYGTQLGKWTVKAGLRGEHTKSDGESITIDSVTVRDYFNLFPSLFLQRSLSENYMINLNYSRRIDRPQYRNLNPFIFYLDPYTWAQGNPLLLPQYTHSVQFTQTFKRRYNLILGFSQTKQFITEVPFQDVENLTTAFIQSNVDDSYTVSANLVLPFQFTDWWTMNNNLSAWHQNFTTFVGLDEIRNSQTSWNFRSGNTLKLGKNTRGEVTFNYRSAIVYGLYHLDANWGLDLGIKKSLFKGKLDASLNARDIFKTQLVVGSADIAPNVNSFDQYFNSRTVVFSLSYRFSKGQKFQSRNRNINLDELNRTGGQ
ncbi:outer membrane beta-barrel protein [Ekhidna sp.]|uniref:outer membrane beta-barrel protein n=1 Tax=Ekhidna sp. TaxID=2608089 RepID=UPI003B5A05BA